MPPKTKDSKSAAIDPEAAAAEHKALMESELVTAVLRSRLGRYQAVGEKLAVENFSLTDELAKQKLTLQDINEFLTNELKARSLAAAQLEERVSQLSTRLAEVQKESQAEIARVKAEAAAEVSAATARAAAAAASAAVDAAAGEGNPADAAGQKAQLERTVAELTATLSARQKDFEARLSDMERRHLQEKEKMRKEAAAKIRETKTAMAQLADQHLESSTKRTLVENETMVAELAYHTAQSHDLVAANGILRNEAAELKRQLAIAHKTLQSTSRKNLLLQQTIKSILSCLREEARHNAEAAIAAHQQPQQHPDSPCATATYACHPSAAGGAHLHAHGNNSPHWHQQQQQEEEGGVAAGDADAVLQQLEVRVVQLADELSAARQALAAALQGVLQQDLQAMCAVTCSTKSQTVLTCSTHGSDDAQFAAAAGADLTCGSQHKTARRPRQQQQQQPGEVGSRGERGEKAAGAACCCCGGSGQQPGAMEAALEDGVAAFVLYAVQQLRRGQGAGSSGSGSSSITPSRQGTAGAAAAVGSSTPSRGGGVATRAAAGSSGSRSSSPAAAGAAGAGLGKSRQSDQVGAAGRAGGCSTNTASRASVPAVDGADAEGVGARGEAAAAAAAGAGIGEQLARLLLEQLHSYSRQNLAAYDGLAVAFEGAEQPGAQRQQQYEDAAAACQVQADSCQWPIGGSHGPLSPQAALLQQSGGGEVSTGTAVSEECSTSLQLPPLPSLLNNMGRSIVLPPPAAAAVGVASSSSSSSLAASMNSRSPGAAADREGLFSAVLSELRPWGPAGSTAPLGLAGALTSPSKQCGAAAAVLLPRSKTPTSPAATSISRGSPLSSPSSKGISSPSSKGPAARLHH